MITADQLIAHAVGDYILQSDWMANGKTRRHLVAAVHAIAYALPFLLLSSSLLALAVIVSTHFVIDRWRLARFIVSAKNVLLAPPATLQEFDPATGSPVGRPAFLSVWLLIIADNILHILINAAALRWL